ncbi:MAG: SGNH/GDSL hydrolase family protein [Bacteroidota bacterium]
MIKILVLMAGLMITVSCIGKSELPEYDLPEQEDNTQAAKKYLALGDSYTIGEAVPAAQRFPVQLQQSLVTGGIPVNTPEIIARTGWTTDELMNGIREAHPRGQFDLVTLLIGVNNQYRGRDTAEYRRQFRELLNLAIGYAGNKASRVIVLSIPDYAITPFGQARDMIKISREIDWFNRINLQETRNTQAVYVDITPISRRGQEEPRLVAADGLHPSGEMYKEWVGLLLPEAKKILGKE